VAGVRVVESGCFFFSSHLQFVLGEVFLSCSPLPLRFAGIQVQDMGGSLPQALLTSEPGLAPTTTCSKITSSRWGLKGQYDDFVIQYLSSTLIKLGEDVARIAEHVRAASATGLIFTRPSWGTYPHLGFYVPKYQLSVHIWVSAWWLHAAPTRSLTKWQTVSHGRAVHKGLPLTFSSARPLLGSICSLQVQYRPFLAAAYSKASCSWFGWSANGA
jgi:hypothetical protein